MGHSAPGKGYRKGIALLELAQMFPTGDAAKYWVENIPWLDGIRYCPNCRSDNTHKCSHAKMPYRCHNIRELDMVEQMAMVAGGLTGRFLSYEDLIEPNGLESAAQA